MITKEVNIQLILDWQFTVVPRTVDGYIINGSWQLYHWQLTDVQYHRHMIDTRSRCVQKISSDNKLIVYPSLNWLSTNCALTIDQVLTDIAVDILVDTTYSKYDPTFLGSVYMTPGQLSSRGLFTRVPANGSIFVYMIPPQNVMLARVTPAWVHPGSLTEVRISLRYEILQRYHVNPRRAPISVWNRSAGRLERVAHA